MNKKVAVDPAGFPYGVEYKDMCYDCGKDRYRERRKDGLVGIGVSVGKCSECGEKRGIIPGRDWAFRAGEFRKMT